MTLLNVERIKLFSTRSPYWCLVAIAVAALGFATLFGLIDEGRAAIPYLVLRGTNLGMSIFMVLAALSITTEYRFGTIRNTFLAAPRRPAVLPAKTAAARPARSGRRLRRGAGRVLPGQGAGRSPAGAAGAEHRRRLASGARLRPAVRHRGGHRGLGRHHRPAVGGRGGDPAALAAADGEPVHPDPDGRREGRAVAAVRRGRPVGRRRPAASATCSRAATPARPRSRVCWCSPAGPWCCG